MIKPLFKREKVITFWASHLGWEYQYLGIEY